MAVILWLDISHVGKGFSCRESILTPDILKITHLTYVPKTLCLAVKCYGHYYHH